MLTEQGLSIYMFLASKLSSKTTFRYSALLLGLLTPFSPLPAGFAEEIGREREDLFLALPVKVSLAVGFSLQLPLYQAHEPSQRHSTSQLFLALRRASSHLVVSVSPTS